MSLSYDVLIVGAGHGGAQAAIALRQQGFAGTVALVGEEPELPYERPPLSKDYLAGDKPFERLLIRPRIFWTDRRIDILTGRRVVALDPMQRNITTAAGEIIGYRTLVWSAGGRARRLSCAGHDLAGVHSVRNRADVDRMIAELPAVERICVVGGGYVGLEAAAVLAKLAKSVTLLEAQERVLARVAGATLSRFYETEHRSHGVDLRLGTCVDHVIGSEGRVTGVRLADGETMPCEMLVVGIGILPEIEPLRQAGINCGNGVVVDACCRTSHPDIYAIGDSASHRSVFADWAEIRIESVQNANDMANVVARAITGHSSAYNSVPWFWSNQYDLKLQTVGLSTNYDCEIVRGDPFSRSFSIVYLRSDRVVALDCVNMVRDYVQGKALLLRIADPLMLADASTPIRDIAAGLQVERA